MAGWVKLYRELVDKPIWRTSTPAQKSILVTILLMANHEPNEWEWNREKFSITKGQFVTSLQSIANKCGKGISVQNVRTAISRFSDLEFLTCESTKMGRIITICNWCRYQPDKKEINKGPNKPLTTNKNERIKDSPNSDEFRLANYLYKHMLRNNPNAKEPNFKAWAKTFDYIIRIDHRPVEEIRSVIEWCQRDKFWFKIILSPDKLRKQYDTLYLQMEVPEPKKEIMTLATPE